MTKHTDQEHRCPSCNYQYTLRLQSEMGMARCPRCDYSYRVEMEDNGFKALVTKEEAEAYREEDGGEIIKEKNTRIYIAEGLSSKKRRCPICKEECSVAPFQAGFVLSVYVGCRKCKYDIEVQIPFYWLAFITVIALTIALVITIGYPSVFVFVLMFCVLQLDAHLLLSRPMNKSLDKSILRRVSKVNKRTEVSPSN